MNYKDITFLEALKIKQRMTKDCSVHCPCCPLSDDNNGLNVSCGELCEKHPEEYLGILDAWNHAHPVKTVLQDFLEKYPNASITEDGTPEGCPFHLGKYKRLCAGGGVCDCVACWNQPTEEQK